jgi:hypothetical protein
MVKIHRANFFCKNSQKAQNEIDNFLSVVQSLISEHSRCRHTGKIKFVVNMRGGVPIDVKTVFEVEREINIEP